MGSLLARMASTPFRPERDIPDLSGKVILVTGGNTGIGYETVKQLLLKNAKVYLAARSADKAAAAIKQLEGETKRSAIFIQLDLADLPSVRKTAERFLELESRLDILFNNGGVMFAPPEMLTAQEYDLQFGTNALGHFLLTELLLPALIKSHEETKVPARIINTTSMGHQFAPRNGVEWASLKAGPERDAWVKSVSNVTWRLYGQSKLTNIIISNHWSDVHTPDVLVSCAVHPGVIKTELIRHSASWFKILGNFVAYPAPMGAYTQLWGAFGAPPEQINGKYLVPWGQVGTPDKNARNKELQTEVVKYLNEQIKDF